MKWEYMVIGIQDIRADCEIIFNRYGAKGWELVSANGNTAYFKRPNLAAMEAELKKRWAEAIGGKID